MRSAAFWLLIALALVIRGVAAAGVSFPPLDDPAFYFTVAANIAQGRGLVIDAIWSYQVPFATVTHPSNEYWMPLTSFVLAPALALFGATYRVAQAVGVLMGVTVVGLTFAIVWSTPALRKDALWLGPVAGLLVALNPLLVYQAATADSAVVFSLIAGMTLLVLARCPTARPGTWALAGVGLGLAYLTRNDGALLLPAALMFWWLARRTPARVGPVGAGFKPAPTSMPTSIWPLPVLLLAFGLIVGAWLIRNALTFGSPFPASAAAAALAPDYPALFQYPAPTFSDLAASANIGQQLALRIEALMDTFVLEMGKALLILTPISVVGLWILRREHIFQIVILVILFHLLGTTLVFPVPSIKGTIYHSVGALIPFLTVAALVALKAGTDRLQVALGWQRPLLPVMLAGILTLTVAQLVVSQTAVWQQHQAWAGQFGNAAAWLHADGPDATVMTTQPHSLHYASGLPAVMLPAAQAPAVALEVARRYGVRYLVLTERFGRYPDVLDEASDGAFRLVHRAPGLEIYEVVP